MKKIIITGATGFIGLHLINEWLKDDVEIYAIVRKNSNKVSLIPQAKNIHIIECDMCDYILLSDKISGGDFFYHLAWDGTRNPYRDDPIIQKNNYECSIEAFKLANALGCSLFLGIGSQAEYGSTKGSVDEKYPCNPSIAYGKEKLHTYMELSKMANECGMKFIWVRIFSLYGKYDYPGTLIMSALKQMQNNETIEMTLGIQLWDYLNVEDAVKAIKKFAITECNSGVYNMASGNYKPLKEFITDIKKITGSHSVLKFGTIPYGIHGPVNLTPCVNKIKTALNWKPEITFEDGIKKIVD